MLSYLIDFVELRFFFFNFDCVRHTEKKDKKIPQVIETCGTSDYAIIKSCQSWGLSLNMAEVSVNSFRTSLYLGCIVGIIKVALLKTPSESLIEVVMQVNELENS